MDAKLQIFLPKNLHTERKYWILRIGLMGWHTLGSFGNFGLEIQTWESTSALMSKSDNQLVEIWNSFGVYVEIIKKLSSLVDSHLVTHYIIKELAHFAKEMVTNKWKGNEMGINKWITKKNGNQQVKSG